MASAARPVLEVQQDVLALRPPHDHLPDDQLPRGRPDEWSQVRGGQELHARLTPARPAHRLGQYLVQALASPTKEITNG
jgi:hypothetical protein